MKQFLTIIAFGALAWGAVIGLGWLTVVVWKTTVGQVSLISILVFIVVYGTGFLLKEQRDMKKQWEDYDRHNMGQ